VALALQLGHARRMAESHPGEVPALLDGAMDELRKGSGLRGLGDRVAALDGTLTVESPPGGGTHLHVEIPCS
jgi:signal transduction histidine kinase